MKRILWAGLALIAVMMLVFGISLAEGSGGESNWNATVEGEVLILSGSGAIPGLEDPASAEWAESRETIREIFIEDGITAIGKNVLSGFTDPELRIDFRMSDMPEIDPEAFAGTTAVCRYYSDNAGWTGGSFGGNLTWIYLPEDIHGSNANMLVYKAEEGWSVQIPDEFGGHYPLVTAAQAAEMLWKSRAVALFDLPEREEDWAVVEDFKATYFVSFQEDCAGTKTFTIGDESGTNIGMDVYAPGLVLEVNAAEGKLGTISVGGGQVTVNGDVPYIVADGFQTPHEGNHPSLTVNGNVRELNFYDATSDRGFTGDLTITGTLEKGTEYGSGTISIPHISDSVELGSINTASFSDIQQQVPIILNGRLNVENVQPLDNMTVDMFNLYYSFFGKDYLDRNDWRLSLNPRPEYSDLGAYGAYIDNVADYNPTFTVDDIVWGDHTGVSFWQLHDAETIVLNGQTDANGNLLGLESCSARDVNLIINCPVQELNIEQYPDDGDAPVNCTINHTMDRCWINVCGTGNHVTLGENGRILEGGWERGIRGSRYFGPVEGAGELYANQTLQVLNWKSGENIQAILPANDTVTDAAGLEEGQTAVADISESGLDQLTPEEASALEDYLEEQGYGTPAAVFEATVTSYSVSDSGEWTENGNITKLNQEIPFTVSNDTGDEAYILRLHEDEDGEVVAEQLGEASDGDLLSFSSDLFSHYVIVSRAENTQKLSCDGREYVFYPALTAEPGSGLVVNADPTAVTVYVPEWSGEDSGSPQWTLTWVSGPEDPFELTPVTPDGDLCDDRAFLRTGATGSAVPGTYVYRIRCDYNGIPYTGEVSVLVQEEAVLGARFRVAPFDADTGSLGDWETVENRKFVFRSGEYYAVRMELTGSDILTGNIEYFDMGDVPGFSRENFTNQEGQQIPGVNGTVLHAEEVGVYPETGTNLGIRNTNVQVDTPVMVVVVGENSCDEGVHSYLNGECVLCGTVCSHQDAQEVVENTATEFEWNSPETHTVWEICDYHLECGECGYIGDTQRRMTSTEEPHSDPDQDGICDICGFGPQGQIEWEMATERGGRVLHVFGNGPIPDYTEASQAPWAGQVAEETDLRIVIDKGISRIGSHAFGNMNGTVRVDFLRSGMPAVDEEAFAGTEAVCRYYANNESWTSGTAGRTDARWIFLPYFDEEDYVRDLYFNGTWYITPRSSEGYIEVGVTYEQALEYTHEWRHLHFDALPTTPEDLAFVSSWDKVGMLYFNRDCEGVFDITLSGNSIFGSMDFTAPDLTLNVFDPRPEGAEGRIIVNNGTVNYHGNIGELLLECSYGREGHVLVDGDISQLNYYETSSDRAYSGDLTVTGTILTGSVYGEKTLAIPGIGDAIPFGGMVTYTFSDIRQQEPVILNSALNLNAENQEKLVSSGELTADMFNYYYQFLEGRIFFQLYAKDPEYTQYSATIEDIYDYNPDFTTDDVIYGEGTGIFVGLQDHTTLVFNGAVENGTKIGLRELSMEPACNVVLNCPVNTLEVNHFAWSEGAVELQINDQVGYCRLNISRGRGTTVSLGENGKILAGQWERPLHDSRSFATVDGPCDLFADERLNVLSAKSGQSIQSLLPSDSTVTDAAGRDATVDVNESDLEELTPDESQALEDYLAENGGSAASVFDVSVTSVVTEDDGETVHMGEEITTLNEPISLTVSNESDSEAYILRLHEGPDGTVSADPLCDATDTDTLTFESDLFSKYIIVAAGDVEIDPDTLMTLRLPAALTRIEDNAFESGAFQAVILPDGCAYVGHEAFKDCPDLIYVSYPAGTVFEEDAFSGCHVRQWVER